MSFMQTTIRLWGGLRAYAQKSHHNIDFAEDGQKAVEMWEKGGYDLVLMDV
jgi:CheY-like chemotaxis protein